MPGAYRGLDAKPDVDPPTEHLVWSAHESFEDKQQSNRSKCGDVANDDLHYRILHRDDGEI